MYQQNRTKNCRNFLAKGLKDQRIGMNINQSQNKNTTSEYIFSNQNLKELTDCLFWFIQLKMKIQKGIKP